MNTKEYIYQITYSYLEGARTEMQIVATSPQDALSRAMKKGKRFMYDVTGLPLVGVAAQLIKSL